jgi:homoprotocatechuate degradation regulator HpaR
MLDESEFAMRGFARSLPMVLLRARDAALALFRPMLAEHGLTEQQWRVLRALASDRAPMDAGELAGTTFLLAPSLSRILVTLESQSLIRRDTPEHDRRRSIISLSPSGRDVVARIAPHSEAVYARLEGGFGAERLDALIVELNALSQIAPSIDGRPSRRPTTPSRPDQ